MKIYKIFLKPNKRYITPIKASTLFGLICWQIQQIYGEDLLQKFLSSFTNDNTPPFQISDGFLKNFIPVPYKPNKDSYQNKDDEILYKKTKFLKKSKLININYLQNYLQDFDLDKVKYQDLHKIFEKNQNKNVLILNTLNKKEENLFSIPYFDGEIWLFLKINKIDILELFSEQDIIDIIKNIFTINGYGKKANLGYGLFEFKIKEVFNDDLLFKHFSDKNKKHVMTLSDMTPKKNDPRPLRYTVINKQGKLYLHKKNESFIKPILYKLTAGSSFLNKDFNFLGKMLDIQLPTGRIIKEYSYGFEFYY